MALVPARPKRVTRTSFPRVLPGVADWGALRRLLPGHRVGLWYSDDDVWHERTLIWPATDDLRWWYVLTPDGDLYCEKIDGSDPEGCEKLCLLGDDGSRPVGLEKPIYAFQTPIEEVDLFRHMKEAQEEAVREHRVLVTPGSYCQWDGRIVPLPANMLPIGGVAPQAAPGVAAAGGARKYSLSLRRAKTLLQQMVAVDSAGGNIAPACVQ